MANEQWSGGSGAGGTPDPYGAPPPGAWQQPSQPAQWQQPGYQQPGPPGQWYGPPPGYPQYPFAPPQRTNGMAIASLVLGILWIYWIGSILALVFGYIARNQIRQRGEAGGGLALAGIILGWVGIGLLALALGLAVASSA
jgi:hypothetical protein